MKAAWPAISTGWWKSVSGPGVTDNVGKTAREAMELLLGEEYKGKVKVYTSRQYLIKGKVSAKDIEKIASGPACQRTH